MLKSMKTLSPFLRLSMCALGAVLTARFCSEVMMRRPAVDYYHRARKEALEAMENPSLESLQGLLALYECSMVSGMISGGWMLLGMATRMAMLLQLNVDPDEIEEASGEKMPWVIKETRRRCWHACSALDSLLATAFTRFPQLTQSNVKLLCSDDIWESLSDPAQLEHLFYNPPPESSSLVNNFFQLIFLFRKIFTTVFKSSNPAGANNSTPATFTVDETARILTIQNELHSVYIGIPGVGRIPLDVTKFTRGCARNLINSQTPLAQEFKEWIPKDGIGSLAWGDLLVGKEWIFEQGNQGSNAFGFRSKCGAVSTTTSPEDWFFEMWNRDELPPWKAIGVNYSYHHCVILLHNRRLFGFVKMLAELKSQDSSAVESSAGFSLDLITLESIDMAFQSCRNSAEHICIITRCILDSITSTNVQNVFPSFTMQALFHSSLVLVMLIASRSYRFIHCQAWPNGVWDSEIDDDTVKLYFEWLDMAIEVIESNMVINDAKRILLKELERLLRRLKRGEIVRTAAVEASKAGVSVEDNVALAAAALREARSNREFSNVNSEVDDLIGGLSEDFKSVMVLERLRDIRNHTNAIADVVEKSAVASVRSVSVSVASGSPAISVGGVSSDGGDGFVNSGQGFGGFTREIVEESVHVVGVSTDHSGYVEAGDGLVGVDVTNGQVDINAMMGMDNVVDGDFGLSNVASTVEDFLDLLSMDWSGENGQTDNITFQGMGFDGQFRNIIPKERTQASGTFDLKRSLTCPGALGSLSVMAHPNIDLSNHDHDALLAHDDADDDYKQEQSEDIDHIHSQSISESSSSCSLSASMTVPPKQKKITGARRGTPTTSATPTAAHVTFQPAQLHNHPPPATDFGELTEAEVKFLIGQADKLRSLYAFNVFHRRTMLKSMQTLSPFLRLSMCALGAVLTARFCDEVMMKRPAVDYYHKARKESLEAMENPSLESMQGLLALYDCSTILGMMSGGWMLLGMATRMTMLLQLNVDPDDIEAASGEKMPW
ncbi:hypothetical protein HDU76_002637, partial [Blyttiomyces sp. JEL0837]